MELLKHTPKIAFSLEGPKTIDGRKKLLLQLEASERTIME